MIFIRDRMKDILKKNYIMSFKIHLILDTVSTRFVCHCMRLYATVITLNKAFTPRISQNFLLYIM